MTQSRASRSISPAVFFIVVIVASPAASRHAQKASGAHAQTLGIEQRLIDALGLAAPTDNLDLETRVGRRSCRRHVTQRHRLPYGVGVAARRDPADDLALVPHGLIADGIGVVGLDREGDQPPLRTTIAFLGRRRAPDEVVLAHVDETVEARFIGTVDRPVLARPGPETLFQPQ